MNTPYSLEPAPTTDAHPPGSVSELEQVVYESAPEPHQVEPRDYTGGYVDDAIPHVTINDPAAGFYGAFIIGSDYWILNEAAADRPDMRVSAKRHEITHYLIPNWHMPPASYEHLTLAMSDTVYSERPRGIATFQMQDLDIGRAYENQRYVN
ncbi:MAG: hypothetical protein ACMXYM_01030 [Candidatus Woesearchaeota archaeon]